MPFAPRYLLFLRGQQRINVPDSLRPVADTMLVLLGLYHALRARPGEDYGFPFHPLEPITVFQ